MYINHNKIDSLLIWLQPRGINQEVVAFAFNFFHLNECIIWSGIACDDYGKKIKSFEWFIAKLNKMWVDIAQMTRCRQCAARGPCLTLQNIFFFTQWGVWGTFFFTMFDNGEHDDKMQAVCYPWPMLNLFLLWFGLTLCLGWVHSDYVTEWQINTYNSTISVLIYLKKIDTYNYKGSKVSVFNSRHIQKVGRVI